MKRLTAALAAASLLAACATLPTPDAGERLMRDVRVLAADDMGGRATGREGAAMARVHVLRRFRQAGLRPGPAGWEQPFAFTTKGGDTVHGVNLVGMVRGRSRPGEFIVVTAHYDHEGVVEGEIYNGADDNASGVASLFELARRLRAKPPEHSVLFVALDAEEMGLKGAEAFVAEPPVPVAAMRLNINLDMISRLDTGEIWAVGTHPYPGLRAPLEAVAARSKVKLSFGRDRPEDKGRMNWVNLSDQEPFHRAGVPFVFFSVDDHPDYHRPTDDADRIPVEAYAAAVETIVDAFRTLDAMDLTGVRR